MPGFYMLDMTGFGLTIIGVIVTLIAQFYVNSKYSKYKKVKNKQNISGVEVARNILDEHGMTDVYVTETKGLLSDHYDPRRKVVRLSSDIFHGTTIAAASVAAHEVGHAIQDKEGYFFIRLRGAIFPIVNIASTLGYVAIAIGFFSGAMNFAWGGIGLLLLLLFFQLITLPVEFDASRRALIELKKIKVLESEELNDSKIMLKAAAYTYVAALATTLLEILRLVLIVSKRDD